LTDQARLISVSVFVLVFRSRLRLRLKKIGAANNAKTNKDQNIQNAHGI